MIAAPHELGDMTRKGAAMPTTDTTELLEDEKGAQEPKKISSRQAVRRLFEEATEDLDEINLPLIAATVVESVKANPELLAAFIEEQLPPMVYQIGFDVIQSQRASASRIARAIQTVQATVTSVSSTTSSPSAPVIRGRLLASPRQRAGFSWLRQPVMIARGRQIRLERATGREMDLAIENGLERLAAPRQRLTYYRLIRDAIPDPDRKVGDVLDDAQLAKLWDAAHVQIEREDAVAEMARQKLAERRATGAITAPIPAT